MEFSWKNEVRPVWSLWTVLKISSSRKLILMELYRVVRLRPQLVLLLIYLWLDVHSHSVPSSILRANGAVVPWCWKERLRRRIFDSWSSVILFWFDTIITHIFLSFIDIRDVVHFHIHIHIHGLASLSLSSPGVRWAVLEPFTLHKIYLERIRREDFKNLLRNLTKIDNKRDTLQSA